MRKKIQTAILIALCLGGSGPTLAVFHPEPLILSPTDQPYAQFGYSAACGDTNGDGYDDVAIGAAHWSNDYNTRLEGRVYVYLGGPNGLEESASWVKDPTDKKGSVFGSAVVLDDFNGDG